MILCQNRIARRQHYSKAFVFNYLISELERREINAQWQALRIVLPGMHWKQLSSDNK